MLSKDKWNKKFGNKSVTTINKSSKNINFPFLEEIRMLKIHVYGELKK